MGVDMDHMHALPDRFQGINQRNGRAMIAADREHAGSGADQAGCQRRDARGMGIVAAAGPNNVAGIDTAAGQGAFQLAADMEIPVIRPVAELPGLPPHRRRRSGLVVGTRVAGIWLALGHTEQRGHRRLPLSWIGDHGPVEERACRGGCRAKRIGVGFDHRWASV